MPFGSTFGKMATNVIGKVANTGLSMLGNVLGIKQGTRAKMDTLAEYGLTPQESVGAAGSANASGVDAALKAQELDQNFELQSKNQRLTERAQNLDWAKAQMAQETAKYVVDTSSKAPLGQLELARRRLPSELATLANKAKTSAPAFQLYMKELSMSAENLIASGLAQRFKAEHGVNILDPKDWKKLDDTQKEDILKKMYAASSRVRRETAGLEDVSKDLRNQFMKIPENMGEYGQSGVNWLANITGLRKGKGVNP